MFWIESGQHVNISLENQETNLFFRCWWHAVPSPDNKSAMCLLFSGCISMPWNACNFGAWVQWSSDICRVWCKTPQTRWQCCRGSKQVSEWQFCINQWCQNNKCHDLILHCLLIQLFISTIMTHLSTLNTHYMQSINHEVLRYIIFLTVLLTYLYEIK